MGESSRNQSAIRLKRENLIACPRDEPGALPIRLASGLRVLLSRAMPPMSKLSYKDAGVDLDLYADAMARLPRWTHRTYSPRVMKLDGGFAGLFRLDFPGDLFARKYEEPVLVSGTDGVGTKLKVATLAQRHATVGVDLVGMCVNDVLCCGAEPLFFLDYVAMSHDDPILLEQIVQGISDGCVQADCALLGGETAIMPDLYAPHEYDLAGFSVGIATQPDRWQADSARRSVAGDRIQRLSQQWLQPDSQGRLRSCRAQD